MTESFKKSHDWGVVLGLIAFASVLRFWNLTNLGLTHFDEGAYAMTGRWIATFGTEGWIYQSGHAPGLFPTLVGLFFWLFGVTDYVAISVSAVAGSLTVGVVYLIGKKWFNRAVGIMAGLCLATAEYHVIYSRLALTDALFTLFFWSAIACFLQGLRAVARSWFLLAGLLTGLCWNTKYHGFFPLVIVGLWLVMAYLSNLRRGQQKASMSFTGISFAYASAAALVVYLPWFLFVQVSVGYSEILGYQLGYIFGDSASALQSPPSALLFYLREWLSKGLLLFAAFGIAFAVIKKTQAQAFLLWTVVAMAIATLFYPSFPRLLLPVVPGLCLLAAKAIDGIAAKFPGRRVLNRAIMTAAVLLFSFWEIPQLLSLSTNAYRQAARYLQRADGAIVTQMSKNFYFYENEKSTEIRRTHMDTLDSLIVGSVTLVAVDPIIHRFSDKFEWFQYHRKKLDLVEEIEIEMYEPVYYQGFDPTHGWSNVSRSLAPFRPGESKIGIYRTRDRLSKSRN